MRRRTLPTLLLCALLVGCGDDTAEPDEEGAYTVVDTSQERCYGALDEIDCPTPGEAFYGQDAQIDGVQPSYAENGDGTVSDELTGLMWAQSTDTNSDGEMLADDKLTLDGAVDYCDALELAGYDDWRLPSIEEQYSLMDFRGMDPSGIEGGDTSGLVPFIDEDYFDFAYGDTSASERIIDSQYASTTEYVGPGELLFGVNFADGRIKGYGQTMPFGGGEKTFSVQCVRGATYGVNDFVDLGDGTIDDLGTGLMWSQEDSGVGLDWEEALAWVEERNDEAWLGHDDWRLPDAKELHSLVDYTRSPDTTDSAAIDPVFEVSTITNEGGEQDYPFFWTSTTHATANGTGGFAVYVSFGRALGYMEGSWQDVHGAGAQRSDPKSGDPADYPTGHGPQGDAIRIYNHVRPVRAGWAS